jgi:beta-lactam-binding protein with PASTA domain
MDTLIANNEDDEYDGEDGLYSEKRRKWVKPVIWTTTLILFLFLTFFGMKLVAGMFAVPDIKVPDLIGLHKIEAKVKLDQIKLIPIIKERFNETVEKDYVIKQGTYPGMTVKEGSSVELYVSMGPETAQMEEVIGRSQREAVVALEQLGIKQEQIAYKEVFNENVPAGSIIDQYPRSGEQIIISRAQIELTVSKGKETIKMPNLIGLKESVAMATLTTNDLVLGEIRPQTSYDVEPGIVFKQWPFEPGADVRPGESIDIYVSSGYPKEAKVVYDEFNITSRPDGVPSEVVIVVSDARGDNIEVHRETLHKSTDFKVKVVLSPQKNAFVQAHQDGNIVYSRKIVYDN